MEHTVKNLRELAKINSDADRDPFVVEVLPTYLKQHSTDSFAWFLFGDALRVVGRFREAQRAFFRALENAETDNKPRIWIGLAMVCSSRGFRSKAEKWFACVGATNYVNCLDWFWILRGANLAEWGRFEEAEVCHRRAIQLNELNAEAYLNLGYVLRAKRMYSDASAAFQKSHDLEPSDETKKAIDSLANISDALALIESLD